MQARRERMERLARLAARQERVVSIWQLDELGFTRREVEGLVKRGYLHRVHRGVYAVGHPKLDRRGWLFAALLSAGDGSFLSPRTAAGIRRLCGLNTWNIEVVVPGTNTRKRPGLILHGTQSLLHPGEVSIVDGLRIATVPLILIQIAPTTSEAELIRMIEQGIRRGALRIDEMEAALHRHAGERGVAKLRRALKRYRPRPFDKSDLERSVAEAIAADPRIPTPERNAHRRVGGIDWELDFFFEKERVALEVDGGRYHLTPQDREPDRLKDAKLLAEGIRPFRITDVRWELDPQGALEDLCAVLGVG